MVPIRKHRASSSGSLAALRFLVVFLILSGAAAILYVRRDPILHAFGVWWVVEDPLVKSDAIVVLGGDSVQGVRVEHAVALYRQGWAPKLLLSGPMLRTDFSEVQLMDAQARRLGVPERAIVKVPAFVDSTLEEALDLRPFLAEHDMRRVIVVTSDFHTRRARMVWRKALGDSGFQVNFSSAPELHMVSTTWWEHRKALKETTLELLKYGDSWWEADHVAPMSLSQDRKPRKLPTAPLRSGSDRQTAGPSR